MSAQLSLRNTRQFAKRFGSAGDDSHSDRSGRDHHDGSKSTAVRNFADHSDDKGRHLAGKSGIETDIVILAITRIDAVSPATVADTAWRHI
jgi:hypothetical protein